MRESKECQECGGIYFRPEGAKNKEWEARRYCSVGCASKVGLRVAAAKREAAQSLEPEPEPEPEQGQRLAELLRLPPEAAPTRGPVLRELRVVRVGPNPRLLLCEYYELASRRTCTLYVKRNDKFTRGMRLSVEEPREELAFLRPWLYTGPAPRRKGKW